MDVFADFLTRIQQPAHRDRVEEVLAWISTRFPQLEPAVRWNQPMFIDHGTYIIGFSVAKPHLAVAPEVAGIRRFSDEIMQAGYDHTDNIFRIRWDQPVDYPLLERIIEFNVMDKADCQTFWR